MTDTLTPAVPAVSPDIHEQRKADHIRINLEEDVAFKRLTTGLEQYFFMHQALPELELRAIDTTARLFGKTLRTPLLISSMTGGTARAQTINHTLAEGAQAVGMAMGLGSMRAGIEDPALEATYQVRDVAPDILLFANLGAVQLNYGYGLDECRRAVDMIAADALILHFNALQEAVQPEGDGNFAGLLRRVEAVCRALPVPVVAKEVGWGFSREAARQLVDAGVAAIDVAGAFIDWGIPTADSLRYCHEAAPDLPLLASGGIRDGIEAAKCIALGASLVGLAGEFLRAADRDGVAGVVELAETITDELRVAMFCAAAGDLAALGRTPLHRAA